MPNDCYLLLKPPHLTELKAVCNMLKRADGFTLSFIRVNRDTLRDAIVNVIRDRLPDLAIMEVSLSAANIDGIVAQLEKAVGASVPNSTVS
jgi:hypothetical protein